MKRTLSIFLFCAILLPALPAFSEAIGWDQAVSEAARANSDLRNADESYRQAELSLTRSLAPFLPKASASASLSQSGDYDAGDGLGTFGDGHNGSNASLSASLNLFNGFADVAARAKARAGLDAAAASRQSVRAQVGYDLRAAFLTLLQAQVAEAQALTIAARRRDNVDLVQLRYEAGRENEGALLQTKALSAQAQWQAHRAQRTRRAAAQDLAQLMGRADGEGLEAQGDLTVPEIPGEEVPADALAGLPSIRQSQSNLVSAEEDLRSARAAWWPSLGASASAGRGGGDWLGSSGSWSASLSLSVPLFQGGSRLADQLSANSRLRVAQQNLAQARLDAKLALRRSLDNLLNGAEQAQVQQRFFEASQVRAEVARAQYTQGLLSFDLWDQIETDLINAQTSALSSLGDAQRAAAAWARDLGRSPLP